MLVALVAALVVIAAVAAPSGGPGVTLEPGRPPGAPPVVLTPQPPTAGLSPGVAGPPARPAPPGEMFGANVNRLFESPDVSPTAQAAGLSALRASGATVARTDALWEASEPVAPHDGVHHYRWGFDDHIAAALATHDLGWLAVLDYSAGWAQSLSGVDHSPPASVADYAAYAAAFAARYGPGGAFWRAHPTLPDDAVQTIEIWNEPDNPAFWSPAPDPASYAAMYLQARAAIAAQAPSVRVLVGGLAHPTRDFVEAMLAAQPELAGHVDGIAIHPYGHDPLAVVANVRSARALLVALGLGGVPLYVTEFGWTTSPPGAHDYVSARLRPGYVAATLDELSRLNCGLAAVLAYTWVTEQRDPADPQQWFGLDGPAGQRTADSRAFATGLSAASSAGADSETCDA